MQGSPQVASSQQGPTTTTPPAQAPECSTFGGPAWLVPPWGSHEGAGHQQNKQVQLMEGSALCPSQGFIGKGLGSCPANFILQVLKCCPL